LSPAKLKNLIITYTLVTPFSESQTTKTTYAQPDGSFRLGLDYALPYQQIWFGVGDLFYACLYANKDLFLELDMKKIMGSKNVSFNGVGVHYLGTDGPLNVYLNNYILYRKPEQQELSDHISKLLISSHPADAIILPTYNKLCDSVKKIEDSYIASNPSPYSWILENERMSDYYAQIITHYFGNTIDDSLWQKMKQHKSYLVSNNSAQFYNFLVIYISALPIGRVSVSWRDVEGLPGLDPSEKALLDSLRDSEKMQTAYPYTSENIKKWTQQLQPRIQNLELIRSLDKNIQRIDSMFSPAKADFLKLRLNTSRDINEQRVALENIIQSMHTSWCMDVAKKEYKRTVAKIDEINRTLAMPFHDVQHTSFGKPLIETSFGASLFKTSGVKALDFLAKLKQSFPRKAIIIDRWATWCAPCLAEMPHSKKLQVESGDLPVVFVYLCTIYGSTESKWKSKVIELKQPGIHFLIEENLDADISNYFSFSGYPGYALIDKTGKYRPGAIKSMSEIANRDALAVLINK
ncbi:MAG TPA: TlpA disulfide reductase family protein, partial [Puia sp.]|nr:TlpA disulfide reductase family protein [Puia sp.]